MTRPSEARRAVLVVGSGRSGSSALAGSLQKLGLRVPGPEVPADDTNPRGFAESQWVVDFHDRLLRRCNVRVADARPQAWLQASRLGHNENVRGELASWLDGQFQDVEGDEGPPVPELVVKDPRLAWFLPIWRSAALRAEAEIVYVVPLRTPPEVIASKQRYYPSQVTQSSQLAGWVNHMLHTERATRGDRRRFVRYDDLLDDWTRPVHAAGEALGIAGITGASAKQIRDVHAFLDPDLHRIRATWDDLDAPKALRVLAEETWALLDVLADADPQRDSADTAYRALDDLRTRYGTLYAEAEAMTQSTAAAAGRRRKQAQQAPAPEQASRPADRAPAPQPVAPAARRRFLRGRGA